MGWDISLSKAKSAAMKGNAPLQSKTINNQITEQVKTFKYLVNILSNYGNNDLEFKMNTFNKINGLIRIHFGRNRTRDIQL
jgi:hypothetical protein